MRERERGRERERERAGGNELPTIINDTNMYQKGRRQKRRTIIKTTITGRRR